MILCFQVVLYNRIDCCPEGLNNFIITVGSGKDGRGNAKCVADGGDVTSRTKIVNICDPPLQGKYVHVMLMGSDDQRLSLCEIEVYGMKGKIILFSS